jgi:hypothetical protein
MHKLTFKNDKANTLAKMLTWANDRQRRIPYTNTMTGAQGLWLVKDEGIYLMSPTDEKFVDKFGVVNTVVYARGYKPTKTNRDTLWDKTHDVSGDDFAEFVTLTADQVTRVLDGGGITIKLNATTLEIAA